VNDLLDDFRRWYEETRATAGEPPAAVPVAVDLATLLGHFIALRQEVNLQTRSVRAQQEQTAEFALGVQQTLEALARPPRPANDSDEVVRPLLRSLVDVYDALATAGAQIRGVRTALLPALADALPESGGEPSRSFWRRLFGSSGDNRGHGQQSEKARQAAERVAAALDGLVTGYTMSLERIDRTLRQHGLEPIEAAGRPFDPESMEALEAVAGSGRPAGEVVEEVRRGYRQDDRIFRCALVRVSRD
jgi:hypothetical protein